MSDSFATPWTVAHQTPLSMGFSRQEYWSGLPLPSTRDLPDPGMEPGSPALQADSSPSEPVGDGYIIRSVAVPLCSQLFFFISLNDFVMFGGHELGPMRERKERLKMQKKGGDGPWVGGKEQREGLTINRRESARTQWVSAVWMSCVFPMQPFILVPHQCTLPPTTWVSFIE